MTKPEPTTRAARRSSARVVTVGIVVFTLGLAVLRMVSAGVEAQRDGWFDFYVWSLAIAGAALVALALALVVVGRLRSRAVRRLVDAEKLYQAVRISADLVAIRQAVFRRTNQDEPQIVPHVPDTMTLSVSREGLRFWRGSFTPTSVLDIARHDLDDVSFDDATFSVGILGTGWALLSTQSERVLSRLAAEWNQRRQAP